MNAEIEENIRKNITWAHLPAHIKQIFNSSPKDYDRCVVSFSIKNQLRYRGNLVRQILRDEKRYYERVVAYSKERLMLFPYHLADMIVKGLRITPFNYYISVVEKLMQAEKSYDTLPNFTAADCLRLLGIGRNEYIELMNRSRSNRGRLFGKRNVKGLLPKVPCNIHIEPWWRVEIGLVLEEDIKLVNEEELAVIDKLIDLGSQTAGDLNYFVVLSLYKKGLIYLDVPITAMDCIQVPPLQGFVMNRILGDYFETLLYKIFVSIDEHTTVGELASVLQVDTELVKQAVSLYCRLQFARKLEPETKVSMARRHPSWNEVPSQDLDNSIEVTPLTLSIQKENENNVRQESIHSPHQQSDLLDSPASASNTLTRKGRRIAFLFDSTLTAFLMMGNLSPGLKKHAVTMFEVGKLCDESLDSFLSELEKVSVLDAEGEGEARRFFDHAVILRSTILALRKLPSPGLDLVRLESLHSLDEATCLRLIQKKYNLLVSMAPLSREVRPITSLSPPHLGPSVPEVNSLWFKLFLYHVTGYGPPSLLLTKGSTLKQLPRMFLGYSRLLVTTWLHEPAVIPVSNILHVNAAVQYSPVLIQAYGVHQPAQTRIVPFPFRADTPSRNCVRERHDATVQVQTGGALDLVKSHPAMRHLEKFIDVVSNCGYLTFVNIGVLDFGCPNKEMTVKLGGRGGVTMMRHSVSTGVIRPNHTSQNHATAPSEKSSQPQQEEPLTITNENFAFFTSDKTKKTTTVTTTHITNRSANNSDQEKDIGDKLQSPDESHFALTPNSSNNSPCLSVTNGFTSQECSDLLKEELDHLDENSKLAALSERTVDIAQEVCELNDSKSVSLTYSISIDALLSPTDENINMFSLVNQLKSDEGIAEEPFQVVHKKPSTEVTEETTNSGEVWTLLDCHFGIPLFDVNANTKICDAIVSGGLTDPNSLENLVESGRKLGSTLLDFISQCQYYPGENMEIMKRGRLVPLPRYSLVFDNGKVSEWSGK